MTMIVFDYAAIRSRMLGEDKVAPKLKASAAPEPVVAMPNFPPPLSEAARRAWLTGDWGERTAPEQLVYNGQRFIGIDPAKPGSDKTIFWRLIASRQGGKLYLSESIKKAYLAGDSGE